MRTFYAAALSVLLATTAYAETINMPDAATIQLLQRYLASNPPDFDKLARESDKARNASEFDRAAVIKTETDRFRQQFMSMKDVDGLVLRVSDSLGEYDSNRGGFPLGTFQPDIFIGFDRWTKVTFDNYSEFSVWKLPVDEAQAVLSKFRYGRSVVLEIHTRPFGTDHTGDNMLRTQVRSVRILNDKGTLLGEMKSAEPDRQIMAAGSTTNTVIGDEKLDLLGLAMGADRKAFGEWAGKNGFTIDESGGRVPGDTSGKVYTTNPMRFTANSKGLPITGFSGGNPRQFRPLPVAGEKFDCGSSVGPERICGEATFSKEEDVGQQRVISLRMVQNIAGATTEQVVAKLTEKYGAFTDSFDAAVISGAIMHSNSYEARQYVWGSPFPTSNKIGDPVTFTEQNKNWQIEAVVFQPEVNRTVLLLQLVSAQEGANPAASTDVRL